MNRNVIFIHMANYLKLNEHDALHVDGHLQCEKCACASAILIMPSTDEYSWIQRVLIHAGRDRQFCQQLLREACKWLWHTENNVPQFMVLEWDTFLLLVVHLFWNLPLCLSHRFTPTCRNNINKNWRCVYKFGLGGDNRGKKPKCFLTIFFFFFSAFCCFFFNLRGFTPVSSYKRLRKFSQFAK